MTDDQQPSEDVHDMWATVVEISPIGVFVKLDDHQEHGQVLVPSFWIKVLGFKPKSITVGTRIRCGVEITWKPSYFVSKVHNIVHKGGKPSS